MTTIRDMPLDCPEATYVDLSTRRLGAEFYQPGPHHAQ